MARSGGASKFRRLLNSDLVRWDDEKVKGNLKELILKLGHFPTQDELLRIHRADLLGGVKKCGGINKFRRMLGFRPIQKPKQFWTEEAVIKALGRFKRFPTQSQLRESGRNSLSGMITRYGGFKKFKRIWEEQLSMEKSVSTKKSSSPITAVEPKQLVPKVPKAEDDDWRYKSILNGAYSTRTNYDNNQIEFDSMLEFENLDSPEE